MVVDKFVNVAMVSYTVVAENAQHAPQSYWFFTLESTGWLWRALPVAELLFATWRQSAVSGRACNNLRPEAGVLYSLLDAACWVRYIAGLMPYTAKVWQGFELAINKRQRNFSKHAVCLPAIWRDSGNKETICSTARDDH